MYRQNPEHMNREIIYKDLGLIPYAEAWDLQEDLFQAIIHTKNDPGQEKAPNYLLFCEHPHVYTIGKSGSDNNLLINENTLSSKGATFFRTNRGGDITYHGPGQIVGYPILDLESFDLGIRRYIEILEESVIRLLRDYGIHSSRLEGASGVWLDTDDPLKARKICAIGVRSSRFVTMHGFAFNVNTDLEFYKHINPCGFTDKGVTSIETELGLKQDIEKVKSDLKDILFSLLQQC
ncbi:MAG: Octanoyltransferase [ANME-2 cluster archaeon]|nr:Octanoyltransferase [ANME-2 cluster archaeon]